MAIASMEGERTLPEKDVIVPNQRSWPEMAKHMGARNTPRRQCLPDEQGLTERSVDTIKGKRKHLHEDLYSMLGASAQVSVPNWMHGPRLPMPARIWIYLPLMPHSPKCLNMPSPNAPLICPHVYFFTFENGPHSMFSVQ